MITSYDNMPLGIYSKILEKAKDESGDADIAIISLLTGIPEDALMLIPLTDYLGYKETASFLFRIPKGAERKFTYEVGAFRLRPARDFRYLLTAQYVDFKEYAKLEGDHIAELLSVLLVPEGKAYGEGYDVLEVQEAIREHLMVTDAIALRDFFVSRLARLTAASLTSLETQARMLPEGPMKARAKAAIVAARASLLDGVGSARWMLSLSLPAVLLRRYIDCGPWNFSTSSATPKTRSRKGRGSIAKN